MVLKPSFTAEEMVRKTIALVKQQGNKSYIHQMCVQGRLPDEFKYAAIALITSCPYKNNWEESF